MNMGTSIKLGGADNASIKMIESFSNGLFFSELVDNSDARIHQTLIKQNFRDGSSLLHGVSDLDCPELARGL